MNSSDGPSFEEIFRFRAPTEEEVELAADDMLFKWSNAGAPVGTQAFFSAPGLQEVCLDFIAQMGASYAKEQGISDEDAGMIVYAGFIGALELVAAIRLRVED